MGKDGVKEGLKGDLGPPWCEGGVEGGPGSVPRVDADNMIGF